MFQTENQFPKKPRLSDPLPNPKTQHKNEVCLQFQRGSCNYGDRSCLTHGIEQIGVDENKNKNPRCSEKTRLCWRFMSGEKCQYGDKCHFIHMRSETTSGVINVLNGEMRKQLPWRTKLCNKWMLTGSCRYGRNCCFAHGASELQNQGLVDAQGYAEGGLYKLVDKNMEGKRLKVKWNSDEKISRVYADWINDMPLEFHTI